MLIIDLKILDNFSKTHPVGSIELEKIISKKMEEHAKSKVDTIPLSKTRKRSRLQMLADQ